ncbi:hypothetical protein MFRU_015g01380 [Monilinia fructicola]|uniref:Uncharacterized protein n=1 Tax=Monilinia fructicola TaxID=38448 RepID=A0A5M9K0H3_MONFR|nr:hypothetical protein EYC84_005863 [Monilinia fructicola]KAG4029600.1 hypothetical protein MFRU_015g01380 [Monilinia fructicola]
MSYTQLQRLKALITSYSESPPRSSSAQQTPSSQPPSPRNMSSSPERPTLISSEILTRKYENYILVSNRLVLEEVETIIGSKLTGGHLYGVAERRDLERQILVLQAINKLSVFRTRKLATWIVRQETLVQKWFERELGVERVDKQVIGDVLLFKLMELIVETVQWNRTVRKWMMNLLFDRRSNGAFEFKKYND